MKSSVVYVLLVAGTLSVLTAQAELLDYQVVYHEQYITHGYPGSQGSYIEPSSATWYGTFSVDSLYIPSGFGSPVSNFTVRMGTTVFDNPSSSGITAIGASTTDYTRLSGVVYTTPETGDRLVFGNVENLGGNGWGTNEINNTFNRRGTHEIIAENSSPEDIVQNGRFARTACGDINFLADLQYTCLDWSAQGLGEARTKEWLQGTGNYVAELTAGSETILSQVIDTPNNPFRLDFEYLFTTTTGTLDVFLGSTLVDTLDASASTEFTDLSILIDNPELLGQSGQKLSFRINGSTGSQVLLDNISAFTVPITPAIWLFCSGLVGLLGLSQRKKA